MNRLQFLFVIWVTWAVICLMLLLFILFRPAAWAAWVDRENDRWAARKRISPKAADRIKRLEKGVAMKLLLAGNILLCAFVLHLLLGLAAPRPFRVAMPPPAMPASSRPASGPHGR